MYKDQLAAAQKALDLALENDSLQEEIKSNMQSEIDFLIEQIAINRNRAEKDFKKERRRKIFWKSMAGVTTLTSLYFWIF